MPDTITITDNRTGRTIEVPIEDGAIRANALRQLKVDDADFGLMSYDPAFLNTASVKSAITFIDGDAGILRYRGYPIEQLAPRARTSRPPTFCSSASSHSADQLMRLEHEVTYHTFLHENLKRLMDGFRYDAHPMGDVRQRRRGALARSIRKRRSVDDPDVRLLQAIRLIAKVPTIAAWSYRHSGACRTSIPTTTSASRRTSSR